MPVFESHLVEFSGLRLGARLCEERQRRGVTLQELTTRCGISTSRLSQIENDLYVPDVDQVRLIARALGLSIDFFLPSDRALPYQVTRYHEVRRQPPRTHPGCEIWPLADLFVGRQIEPLLVRWLPGGEPQFRQRSGLEFAFVQKGRVELMVQTPEGVQREVLERGDCVYLRSQYPHGYRCLDEQPAECIHVLSSPSADGPAGGPWLAPAALTRDSLGDVDSHVMLGAELAAVRRSRGWTTAELAQLADLRERQIEQVEKAERPAPLDVLVRLARVLGKPLRELLHDRDGATPYYAIRRSTEIAALQPRPRSMPTDRPDAPTPNRYHPLFEHFPTQHIYPYLNRIRNVDMQMLVPHEHHGQEFFYILDGQIELVTYVEEERVSVMLNPGDACYLDASVPHLFRGETRNPYSTNSAELIDVYWCPLGENYLFAQRA